MKPLLNAVVHKALAMAGLAAVRVHQTHGANRMATLRRRGIDLVIDVGANAGQYASTLRQQGYSGAIISIEPLPQAFALLEKAMRYDPKWVGLNVAAGASPSTSIFNISADSVCSSFLEPSATLLDAIPSARTVERVEVEVRRLSDVPLPPHTNLMLKLDVQGFEEQTLAGAGGLLDRVEVLELELGLTPSYVSGFTLERALPDLAARGFSITSIGRGVSDQATGQLVDVDVLLERRL